LFPPQRLGQLTLRQSGAFAQLHDRGNQCVVSRNPKCSRRGINVAVWPIPSTPWRDLRRSRRRIR
jgi:hypothetical protein